MEHGRVGQVGREGIGENHHVCLERQASRTYTDHHTLHHHYYYHYYHYYYPNRTTITTIRRTITTATITTTHCLHPYQPINQSTYLLLLVRGATSSALLAANAAAAEAAALTAEATTPHCPVRAIAPSAEHCGRRSPGRPLLCKGTG